MMAINILDFYVVTITINFITLKLTKLIESAKTVSSNIYANLLTNNNYWWLC